MMAPLSTLQEDSFSDKLDKPVATSTGAIQQRRRSSYSLDDCDLQRYKSQGSFGFFVGLDEDAENLAETSTYTLHSVHLSRRLSVDDGTCKEGAQFELHPHGQNVSTRVFHTAEGVSVAYSVAIRGFRVQKDGGGHAQYQVVVSAPPRVWKCWKRYNDFKLLAEYAKISNMKKAMRAWTEIVGTQRWFRCLESSYLKTKCLYLEHFLAQLLFELPSPSLLLTFVQAPRELLAEDQLS